MLSWCIGFQLVNSPHFQWRCAENRRVPALSYQSRNPLLGRWMVLTHCAPGAGTIGTFVIRRTGQASRLAAAEGDRGLSNLVNDCGHSRSLDRRRPLCPPLFS